MPCSVGTVFKLHTKQQLHAQFIRDLQVVISLPAKLTGSMAMDAMLSKLTRQKWLDFNSQ